LIRTSIKPNIIPMAEQMEIDMVEVESTRAALVTPTPLTSKGYLDHAIAV